MQYTHWSLARNSRVYQKTHLTWAAVAAIGLAAGAAFGVVSGFGIKFNFTVQVTPAFKSDGSGYGSGYGLAMTEQRRRSNSSSSR